MHPKSAPRASAHRVAPVTVIAVIIALLLSWVGASAAASRPTPAGELAVTVTAIPPEKASKKPPKKPTVVLVHGAFADASGWNGVASRLLAKGYSVHAPPNPLRGLTSDSAYLATFLTTIDGPVVLVGHSYGGAVITTAATGNAQVKALVYVAAYALAEGENVAAANQLGGGHSDLLDNIVVRPYPGAPAGDGDVYVHPAAFRSIFAQDLPRTQTAVMAAGQRPATFGALVTPATAPAWKTIPSWYLRASEDNLIPPAAQAVMAKRAGAWTRTVRSSHVAMMSRPGDTTDMIVRAIRASR